MKARLKKLLHTRWFRNLLVAVLILIAAGLVWKGLRRVADISCRTVPEHPAPAYTENDRVVRSIALSYLVYGCESCGELSGTVGELLDRHEMGILAENFGIKRTDPEDPASALFDTSDFIRRSVGNDRFLLDRRDESSGFYGAAFCDDEAKCVWIAYAGSVSFRDALACAEFVLAPGLSPQEEQAFALYESVLDSEEVQNLSYSVMLAGHSLGGSLATMVSCASGCPAVTINGADGLAIDKFCDMKGEPPAADRISNYMTSPENGKVSYMDLVQRLMFLGNYKAVDYHVYTENEYTADAHCAFSFIEFEDELLAEPKIP